MVEKDINKTDLEILIEKYHNEIELAIKIDEFNMKQIQMDLPQKRHYWVGRLMHHKIQIQKLKEQRKKASIEIYKHLKKESPIGLNEKVVNVTVENHEFIKKIDNKISDQEILVEYLTRIESNFRDASFSIKNLIAIITLETT